MGAEALMQSIMIDAARRVPSVRDRKRSRLGQLLVHENGMARHVPYSNQAFGLSHNYLGLIWCWFLAILLVPPNDYETKSIGQIDKVKHELLVSGQIGNDVDVTYKNIHGVVHGNGDEVTATQAMDDLSQLLEAAYVFGHYPGAQSNDSARDFLNRFPLTLIINALQTRFDVPDLENTLVACLEKLFNTKLGASFIPQYMPFVQVGLQADSQAVRSLTCKTIYRLLEDIDNDDKVAASVRQIKDFNIYPLLLDCLIQGDEQVAAVATDAIKKLAGFPEGMEIIFPSAKVGETDLERIASQSSSLVEACYGESKQLRHMGIGEWRREYDEIGETGMGKQSFEWLLGPLCAPHPSCHLLPMPALPYIATIPSSRDTTGLEIVQRLNAGTLSTRRTIPSLNTKTTGGLFLVFKEYVVFGTQLHHGRVRVLALVVKLFSVSRSVASTIYSLNLLKLLEAEIKNADDTLVTLSVLELLYELATIEHSTEFLSKTSLFQLLSSMISNNSAESILRSRAMMISGRILPKDIIHSFTDEPCVKAVISSIDDRLQSLDPSNRDECETALESLGHIGSSTQGATLLLSGSSPAARHVIDAAFERRGPLGHGKQLAALHALGNISGETRSKNNIILNAEAEENLRRLIYETASRSSKLTPLGLFLSVLQQDAEIRLAVYRMLCGLVARPWCLIEICSKDDIINKVTNPTTETTKIGMEARYNCCKAIYQSLTLSDRVSAFKEIYAKLQQAVQMGPYLVRSRSESQPAVKTAERF
ncbi:unnamed protein product [Sphenostylis stenocarpa]|uniref:26S proteasome non-ATPase regulatory subunit 5 n=1 Tax=Sphenostylis stenocarpa TaxID=92480 RepID=A0AA87BAL0_9FABA|nr:unnamed protein product [Sphenostylis stenocarpa]